MSLSCSCDYEPEAGATCYRVPDDFERLYTTRRKRCNSCDELINIGSFILRFERYKIPEYEIEISMYGDDGEIPRAPAYLCERCGEIYLNLRELGFKCVHVDDDMRELLKQYQILQGKKNN